MDKAITVKERAFVIPSTEDNNSQDVHEDKWTAQDTKTAYICIKHLAYIRTGIWGFSFALLLMILTDIQPKRFLQSDTCGVTDA